MNRSVQRSYYNPTRVRVTRLSTPSVVRQSPQSPQLFLCRSESSKDKSPSGATQESMTENCDDGDEETRGVDDLLSPSTWY